MSIIDQIKNIDPSDKAALFRRLLYEKDLGFLRPQNGDKEIIGFELDNNQSTELSGFAIIGIQKHTILAYKSDLNEPQKLVIFPTIDKMTDPAFELGKLQVKREIFNDDSFNGQVISTGRFSDVAHDLMPDMQNDTIEISDDFSQSLSQSMLDASKDENKEVKITPKEDDNDDMMADGMPGANDIPEFDNEPFDSEPPFDESEFNEPPFDEDSQFDDELDDTMPDFNTSDDNHDERGKELNEMSGKFEKMSDLTYYVVTHYGVNADMANNVATAAINSTSDPKTQIDVAILLYVKLFDAGKIGDNTEF